MVDAQVLEEARRARWRRVATVAEDDPASYAPCFIAIFVVSSSLILFYFNMLLSISQEFEDPFGADYSDIRLRRDFMEPMLDVFQSLTSAGLA